MLVQQPVHGNRDARISHTLRTAAPALFSLVIAVALIFFTQPGAAEGTTMTIKAATGTHLVFSWQGPHTFPTGPHAFPTCVASAAGAAAELPLSGSAHTLEAWVKPTADVGIGGIVGWGTYGSFNKVNAFRFDGPSKLKHYWWGNDLYTGTLPSLANAFHHVAVTWDGSTRRIYVDFDLVAEKSQTSGYDVEVTDNFCIGLTNYKESFRGEIRDVKIWNCAARCRREEHM